MQKKIYLNELNVLACLAVLVLHANGVYHQFSTEHWWISANIIENLFSFAVPLFFMISGAKQLDYRDRYSTSTFLKKKFVSVVIPFIVWSLIGYLYKMMIKGEYIGLSWKEVIQKLLFTEYITFFWFFIPFIMVLLSFPIFSAVDKKLRKEVFGYAICTAFVFNALLPFVLKLVGIEYNSQFILPSVMGYMIYPLIGYYIANYDISKSYRYLLYILGIVAIVTQIIVAYNISMTIFGTNLDIVNPYIRNNLGVFMIVYCSAIFTFFKYKKVSLFPKLVNIINRYTFGVFLLQWFVFDYIISYTDINVYRLLYRLTAPFVVLGITVCISAIMKKIPVIKNII